MSDAPERIFTCFESDMTAGVFSVKKRAGDIEYIRADAVQPPAELVERLQIAIAAAAGRENTGTEYETVKVCTSLLRDLLAWMDGKP